MEAEETHGLGYERVDDDPNVEVLLATMDTTAEWEATRRLRAWERQQLSLGMVSGFWTWGVVSAMRPSPSLLTSESRARSSASTPPRR